MSKYKSEINLFLNIIKKDKCFKGNKMQLMALKTHKEEDTQLKSFGPFKSKESKKKKSFKTRIKKPIKTKLIFCSLLSKSDKKQVNKKQQVSNQAIKIFQIKSNKMYVLCVLFS